MFLRNDSKFHPNHANNNDNKNNNNNKNECGQGENQQIYKVLNKIHFVLDHNRMRMRACVCCGKV